MNSNPLFYGKLILSLNFNTEYRIIIGKYLINIQNIRIFCI